MKHPVMLLIITTALSPLFSYSMLIKKDDQKLLELDKDDQKWLELDIAAALVDLSRTNDHPKHHHSSEPKKIMPPLSIKCPFDKECKRTFSRAVKSDASSIRDTAYQLLVHQYYSHPSPSESIFLNKSLEEIYQEKTSFKLKCPSGECTQVLSASSKILIKQSLIKHLYATYLHNLDGFTKMQDRVKTLAL